MAGRILSAALLLVWAGPAFAQGRGNTNWTTAGNDAQRSGWVRTDGKISIDSLRKPGFQFLWKIRLEDHPVPPVIVLDPYTGYRGHKSLGFLGGSSDNVFGIDIDLGLIEWRDHVSTGVKAAFGCTSGMTSPLARPTSEAIPAMAGRGQGGGVRGQTARGAVGEAGQGAVNLQPVTVAPRVVTPTAPVLAAVTRPNAVYAVTSDGMLQTLYVSNGADAEPPAKFLPAHSNARGLIVVDNVAYVETTRVCDGGFDGVWSIDLISKQVSNWNPGEGTSTGLEGPAFGPDGTLYVTFGNTLTALEAKTLKVTSSFTTGKAEFTSSPVVFAFGDRILVAAAASDGLHLMDGGKMSVAEHQLVSGGLASWQDAEGTRWILAADKSLAAWKVVQRNGQAVLEAGWISQDIVSPRTPVVVNGVVFGVSGGQPAVLYALDGTTGKPLWNSGNIMTTSVHGGLSAGGSQIYAAAEDGTLYAFGFPVEH